MNAGYLWQECQAALRLYGADDLNQIQMSANMAYSHLANLRSWAPLRRKITISFSSADANQSCLLPGDLIGIDAVYDSNHRHEYLASDQAYSENTERREDDRTFKWFYTSPETDALAILTNVALQQSSNTFTAPGWQASYIGEYMAVGNELGIYLLTGSQTFSPRWYGTQLNGSPTDVIQIRPAGTKRFSVRDYDGKFSATSSVIVYYWAAPTPLYLPNQPILLPDYKPLELLTIINVLGLKDRKESVADNYRAEYDKALAKMEGMNPEFMTPNIPRDRYGHRLSFTGRH
jgi:hypothetical protein